METTYKALNREILLALWKIHILHHASEKPVVGQWMINELRRHGYEISPGTLYPLLKRMEERGWLHATFDPTKGPRARREYTLTPEGKQILEHLRKHIKELYEEIHE